MKRYAIPISAAFCLLFVLPGLPAHSFADAVREPPHIQAEAAALIDVSSGRILYSKNGGERMRIASLTKIMTAIVAIESGNLSDRVAVSPRAYGVEGSSVYLKSGEIISLQNLLYGLMLRSGNDAATAIAEHVGGSQEGFVYLMNEEAHMIGMSDSHFANPHGLDADGHYSTADDMAKLAAYALHNPVFRDIVKTKVKTVPDPGKQWDRTWRNKNKMLSLYDGADGVKTGYTKKAGRCLVSSATRDGRQLAVVTLNDPDDWADHQLLLNYGFDYFPMRAIVEKGAPVPGTPFAAGGQLDYPLADDEVKGLSKKIVLYPQDSLSGRLGAAGQVDIYLKGEKIASVPIWANGGAASGEDRQSSGGLSETGRGRGWAGWSDAWLKALRAVLALQ